MELKAKLQVATMRPEDAGRGIVRVPREWMQAAEVSEGDFVWIEGKRKTPARVVGPNTGDEGLEVVRLDGLQRANAEIDAGDFVTLSKVEALPAKKVVFAPAQKDLRLQGSVHALKRSFGMKPIQEGDVVAITGQQPTATKDIPPDLKKMLKAPAYALAEIRLVVLSTSPKGVVLIDANTEVELRPEYVEPSGALGRRLLRLQDLLARSGEAGLSRFHDDRADAAGADLVGITNEVNAFAQLVLSRRVNPPLSIGIFGEWGAGKSFFMERVRGAVADLAASGDETLHADVVQIRFNAWHYIETNLWASLVEFIFSELDAYLGARNVEPEQAEALFGQLCTAQELKLEAAQELVRARTGLADAEAALAAARAAYRVSVAERAKVVFAALLTADQRREAEAAAHTLGYGSAVQAATQLGEVYQQAGATVVRAKLLRESLVATLGTWPAILAVLAALVVVPVAVTLGRALLVGQGVGWLGEVQGAVLALSAAAGSAAAAAGLLVRKVTAAIRRIEGLRDRISGRLAEQRAGADDPVQQAQHEVQNRQQAVREAEARLGQASTEAANAAQAFAGETAHGRLRRFVRERVAEGDYARHLGLVAAIRRDFALLSDLMDKGADQDGWDGKAARLRTEQGDKVDSLLEAAGDALTESEKESLKLPEQPLTPFFSRIVLYIDDLDRCPPDKVVEVLQAVHLLLFFPLFVVFVAVDARWVARALQSKFPMLSEPEGPAEAAAVVADAGQSPSAIAEHYLEKIFQIPFWVQRMTPETSSRFVQALAEPAVIAGAAPAPEMTEAFIGPMPGEEADPAQAAGGADEADQDPAVAIEAERTQIAISPDELQELARFAPVVGPSPRRLKAFVNRYFLIRAAYFSGGEMAPALACAAVAILAIVTGVPRSCRGLLDQLDSEGVDSLGALDEQAFHPESREEGERIGTAMALLLEREQEMGELEPSLFDSLVVMAILVRRFSFISA